jgi:hypothetical protein
MATTSSKTFPSIELDAQESVTYEWTPAGMTLKITVSHWFCTRESDSTVHIGLKVSWACKWNTKTNYGMKVTMGDSDKGGKYFGEVNIPKFDGDTYLHEGGPGNLHCYFTTSKSVAHKMEIPVVFTHYKTDVSDKPHHYATVPIVIKVPTYYGPIDDVSCKVIDNYNNTFTIKTYYEGGLNDTVTQTLKWGYTSSCEQETIKLTSKSTSTTRNLSISNTRAANRKIYYTYNAKGINSGVDAEAVGFSDPNIKQYVAPSSPGVPILTESSYKSGRLTIKQPWTFLWTPAIIANDSSPVKGYRLRLYQKKKGSSAFTNIPIKKVAGTDLSYYEANGNDYYYDTDSTNNSLTIEPVIHSFGAGDELYLTVFAYTKFGQNNDGVGKLFSGSGTTAVSSKTYTVQNAGVVNVKTASGWKEGQVFVRVGNEWKEAASVNIKTADGWKEST